MAECDGPWSETVLVCVSACFGSQGSVVPARWEVHISHVQGVKGLFPDSGGVLVLESDCSTPMIFSAVCLSIVAC